MPRSNRNRYLGWLRGGEGKEGGYRVKEGERGKVGSVRSVEGRRIGIWGIGGNEGGIGGNEGGIGGDEGSIGVCV